MNKKLIAVAIAAALAPVAAMADSGNVTIYGQMNVSVDSVESGYAGAGQRTTQINDNSSRLGFKGTEALGNGLTAVWQIESSIVGDGAGRTAGFQSSSNGALNARNTFVGLTGGFGTAVLGRHDTPYKLATRSLDVFADNIADNRSIMGVSANGATTFDGRQSNVIAYISPSLSGFTGAIAYVAGAENALTSGQTKGDAWSAMGTYANGPIFASLAYEKHNVGTAGTGTLGLAGITDKNEKAWKLGAGYNMGDFKVGLAYEKLSDNFAADGSDAYGHHAFYLSGAYTMGANVIKAAYTKAGSLNSISNSGVKQWTLGFDHNLSKRTTAYALYSKLTNETNSGYALVGGSNGGTALSNFNSDPSVFSVGMKHSF
ncbi:MAG: porin [Sulfuricella sp.]